MNLRSPRRPLLRPHFSIPHASHAIDEGVSAGGGAGRGERAAASVPSVSQLRHVRAAGAISPVRRPPAQFFARADHETVT